MWRCRIDFAVALLVTVAAFCWWMGLFGKEPSYKGKSATEWLESAEGGGGRPAATAAFRAMGPNGARFLAQTLEKKPFRLPQSVESLISKLHLPEWADPTWEMERAAEHVSDRQQGAWHILQGLGGDAEPALPILVSMFRKCDGRLNIAQLMVPMADKLEFMVPELINGLDHSKADDFRALEDIKLLSAIGAKAKDASAVLLKISQSGNKLTAPGAAVALWNITRETNELIRFFSTNLRSHDPSVYVVLSELEVAGPTPKPLTPLLEQALRHPQPSVRAVAESLLDNMDHERLRQIKEDLNRSQDELLQDHLKLLQSTNRLDRFNAAQALQFFGPKATTAAPRLVEIIGLPRQSSQMTMAIDQFDDKFAAFRTLKTLGSNAGVATQSLLGLLRSNEFDASVICDTLGEIGPPAAEAIPTLQALLATNYVMVPNGNSGLPGPVGYPKAFRHEIVPRWKVAQALVLINPHETNAIAILREAQVIKSRNYFGQPYVRPEREKYFPAAITLWKLGLETNLRLDDLIAEGDDWAFEQLGDIGPSAKKALPVIEKALQQRPSIAAALAIWKIDPEEARRLGLPGLFIICPDKY
jgi:hypothetical protein